MARVKRHNYFFFAYFYPFCPLGSLKIAKKTMNTKLESQCYVLPDRIYQVYSYYSTTYTPFYSLYQYIPYYSHTSIFASNVNTNWFQNWTNSDPYFPRVTILVLERTQSTKLQNNFWESSDYQQGLKITLKIS